MKFNTSFNRCTRMTRDSHNNLTLELQIYMIPIQAPIPIGLILILIPIPGYTKRHDFDSNSNSSRKWFRFWLRFQCFSKYLIPIPASCHSDSNKSGFDSDSVSGISFRFRNHLQLCLFLTFCFTYFSSKIAVRNLSEQIYDFSKSWIK